MSFVSRQRFGAGSSGIDIDRGLKYGKIEHAIEKIKLTGHKKIARERDQDDRKD
jgi:hypothetical protein